MTRARKIDWFRAKPCLEGEFHWLVGDHVIDGRVVRAGELFEKITGRQPRDDDRGRRDGEYRLYPEMFAAACREGVEAEWTLAVRPVTR